MPISEDSSIIPRKLTHSEDAGIIPANLPVTAGGSFAFQQSIYTDGIDDSCATGTSSSVWNPLNSGVSNDSSFNCWLKSDAAAGFNNSDTIFYLEGGVDSTFLAFEVPGGSTTAYLGGKSRSVSFASTYALSSAVQSTWTMYSVVISETRSNQIIKFYVNGVNVDYTSISNASMTHSTTKLSLSSGIQTLSGYQCEAVFSDYAFTDAEVTALYNSGAGEKPTAAVTSVHSYYPVTEGAGKTSGTIVDFMGNADLTMANFAAPNGTSNERP